MRLRRMSYSLAFGLFSSIWPTLILNVTSNEVSVTSPDHLLHLAALTTALACQTVLPMEVGGHTGQSGLFPQLWAWSWTGWDMTAAFTSRVMKAFSWWEEAKRVRRKQND